MIKIGNSDFIRLLDETIEGLYGIHMKGLLYNYIEREYSLPKSEILGNPDVFIEALLSIFGEYGTNLIEREILKAIEANVPLESVNNKLSYEQIVEYSYKLAECVYITQNEAKIYVSLLSRGMMRASRIAKVTEIPRTKIYQYTQNLIEMGMIYKKCYKNIVYFIPKHPKYVFKDHVGIIEGKLNILNKLINELSDLCKNTPFTRVINSLEQIEPVKNS